MERIAPYTLAMDAPTPTPLTTDERLERIEETMKRATLRLESHIDAVSLRKLGVEDWCAIIFKAALGQLLLMALLVAFGGFLTYLAVLFLRLISRH